jgi:hypothetical protein
MKPSNKSPEMEQALNGVFGIDRVRDIEANRCTWCHGPAKEFRDPLSEKEYTTCGFCQKCQDETFGGGDVDTFDLEREERLAGLDKPERQYYTPTENDYVIGRQPMRCGSAEAEERRYHKHIGKSGKIWLVADEEGAAAHVYVEGGPNSDGFGGRTLTFPLVDGTEVKLKGPWHANSDAMFADTGIDVRNQHFTSVCISEGVEYGRNYETICRGALYRDENVLGSFHRPDEIAREWARKLGHRVYMAAQSDGGGHYCFIEPDAVFYWEKKSNSKFTADLTANQAAIVMS